MLVEVLYRARFDSFGVMRQASADLKGTSKSKGHWAGTSRQTAALGDG